MDHTCLLYTSQRQHDAPYHLRVVRAVYLRRLLYLHGYGVEIALHVPDAENAHAAGVNEHQTGVGIEQPAQAEYSVVGEEREHLRKGVEH